MTTLSLSHSFSFYRLNTNVRQGGFGFCTNTGDGLFYAWMRFGISLLAPSIGFWLLEFEFEILVIFWRMLDEVESLCAKI
ncbi:hypothetical protein CsatA_020813 [Cannabis sativa]